MLSFPPTVQVYIAREPVDMRKSYDGLSGCVEQILHSDPLSGHLFVFFNRRRNQVKILVWDRTGYCIYCKRLEQGYFTLRLEIWLLILPGCCWCLKESICQDQGNVNGFPSKKIHKKRYFPLHF